MIITMPFRKNSARLLCTFGRITMPFRKDYYALSEGLEGLLLSKVLESNRL